MSGESLYMEAAMQDPEAPPSLGQTLPLCLYADTEAPEEPEKILKSRFSKSSVSL